MAVAAKGKKNRAIESNAAKAVLDSVKGIQLEKVVNDVGSLQVKVQDALASLSADMTVKIQSMREVDAAIQLKETRLKELHNIEAEAVTLDDMIAQKAAEQEAWDKSRLERAQKWQEEAIERAKRWSLEDSERGYAITTRTKRENDEFASLVEAHQRAEAIRLADLQRDWDARTAAIVEQELEIAGLKAQVAEFPTKLDAAVKAAEATLSNTLKRQYDGEIAMLRKDNQFAADAARMSEAAAEAMATDLRSQIATLQAQLLAARTDAKEVATKALEASSGQAAMKAMQDMASTQNSGTPKR